MQIIVPGTSRQDFSGWLGILAAGLAVWAAKPLTAAWITKSLAAGLSVLLATYVRVNVITPEYKKPQIMHFTHIGYNLPLQTKVQYVYNNIIMQKCIHLS